MIVVPIEIKVKKFITILKNKLQFVAEFIPKGSNFWIRAFTTVFIFKI